MEWPGPTAQVEDLCLNFKALKARHECSEMSSKGHRDFSYFISRLQRLGSSVCLEPGALRQAITFRAFGALIR